MAVPQCVFSEVPTQRLEMPKSVIFTQMGERDAMRIFCGSQLKLVTAGAVLSPPASDHGGRSHARA